MSSRILKDLDIPLEGRHVLVVEDIIDSGLTLSYLMQKPERAAAGFARGLRTLLTKPARREIDIPVRYVGFEIRIASSSSTGSTSRRAVPEPPLRRRPAGKTSRQV